MKDQTLNIVFVNPEYPSRSAQDHGGIATYIYSMANALAHAGNTVHVLAKAKTNPDELAPGVMFHTFDHLPVCRMLPSLDRLDGQRYGVGAAVIRMPHGIWRLKFTGPHRLTLWKSPNTTVWPTNFSAPLPFPVVVHFHTPTEIIDHYNQRKVTSRQRRWYAYEARALKRAQGFRCPSNSLKKEVCSRYGIPGEQVCVIPHPLATVTFDVIKRNGNKKKAIDILFSGRLERRKGGEILQRDIHRILSVDPRINLTFAGELDMGEAGSFRNPIERSLTEEQRHRIWLLGPAKRGDLPVLYRHSDIFLIPSLFENAPYALLEAMAAKLPVVGADTSGIAELIRHNETGLLFSTDDPDGAVSCIKSMIDSPRMAADCAQKAYDYVKRTCDPEAIAMATISFYAGITNSFAKIRT